MPASPTPSGGVRAHRPVPQRRFQHRGRFKALAGGELKGITQLLQDCRREALARLAAEAETRGANAVVAFRFETTEFAGTGIEVCAYGTAVSIEPLG